MHQDINEKDFFPASWIDNSSPISNEKTCGDETGVPNNHSDAGCKNVMADVLDHSETSDDVDDKAPICNGASLLSESVLPDYTEPRGSKRANQNQDLKVDYKKSRTVIIESDDETNSLKDNLPCNVANSDAQIESKENFFDSGDNSLPLQSPNEKFDCTACSKIVAEVHQHPLLKVIVCQDCKCLMEEKIQLKVCS